MEKTAIDYEKILAGMSADKIQECGGIDGVTPPVYVRRERGVAWSRINENAMAGNSEFRTPLGVCWTDAFLSHYVEKYNVRPSRSFEEFVESFDLDAFIKKFDWLQNHKSSQSTV